MARIARALEGCAAERDAIGGALREILDRDRTWVLGVTPDELATLFARAAAEDT